MRCAHRPNFAAVSANHRRRCPRARSRASLGPRPPCQRRRRVRRPPERPLGPQARRSRRSSSWMAPYSYSAPRLAPSPPRRSHAHLRHACRAPRLVLAVDVRLLRRCRSLIVLDSPISAGGCADACHRRYGPRVHRRRASRGRAALERAHRHSLVAATAHNSGSTFLLLPSAMSDAYSTGRPSPDGPRPSLDCRRERHAPALLIDTTIDQAVTCTVAALRSAAVRPKSSATGRGSMGTAGGGGEPVRLPSQR